MITAKYFKKLLPNFYIGNNLIKISAKKTFVRSSTVICNQDTHIYNFL